jgi:hypothetical protein
MSGGKRFNPQTVLHFADTLNDTLKNHKGHPIKGLYYHNTPGINRGNFCYTLINAYLPTNHNCHLQDIKHNTPYTPALSHLLKVIAINKTLNSSSIKENYPKVSNQAAPQNKSKPDSPLTTPTACSITTQQQELAMPPASCGTQPQPQP